MIKFDIKNEKLIIDPQFLMFDEFIKIWESDKTKGKLKAHKLLRFVFHLCDLSLDNPLRDHEFNKKEDEAKFRVYGKRDYTFNEAEIALLTPAIECYNENNVTSEERMMEVFNKKIDQIKTTLNSLEPKIIENTNPNTGEVRFSTNVDIITKSLKEIDNLLESKYKIKAKLLKESAGSKVRGGLKQSALTKGMFKIDEDKIKVK